MTHPEDAANRRPIDEAKVQRWLAEARDAGESRYPSPTQEREVVYQPWVEAKRGSDTRPLGCSIHQDLESWVRFLVSYWDSLPDYVPEIYARYDQDPTLRVISAGLYTNLEEAIAQGEYGLRFLADIPEELK